MNCIQSKENLNSVTPSNILTDIRSALLESYSRYGESKETIDSINLLAKEYFRLLKNSSYYRQKLRPLFSDASAFDQYYPCNLIDHEDMKFSVHLMPKNTEIPMHAHPGKINLIMLEQGSLHVEQKSLGFEYARSHGNNFTRLLDQGNTCSGLPVRNNMHQLKAIADFTVFFSLRISTEIPQKQNTLLKPFLKRHFPALLGYLLIPLLLMQNQVLAAESIRSTNKKDVRTYYNGAYSAARDRKSNIHERQAKAVRWYKQSATQGNAESQYWLGMMNLKGNGVTEDNDEALKWISLSAKQGYPPAEELYQHLLKTDFYMEC